MKQLEKAGVVYTDLKPENILLVRNENYPFLSTEINTLERANEVLRWEPEVLIMDFNLY